MSASMRGRSAAPPAGPSTTICKTPGKIGILVGNHRYRCQETNESGFRSYFREHPRGFELLEAESTFETASIAREVTERLLERHPDLAGLFVSGGGISGAVAALRESGRAKEIVTVGYDLTEVTRAAIAGRHDQLSDFPSAADARQRGDRGHDPRLRRRPGLPAAIDRAAVRYLHAGESLTGSLGWRRAGPLHVSPCARIPSPTHLRGGQVRTRERRSCRVSRGRQLMRCAPSPQPPTHLRLGSAAFAKPPYPSPARGEGN